MEKFLSFRKVEVTGKTKEEALAKAPFGIMGNATEAFKKWKKTMTNGITESDVRQFMLDYLKKKSKNLPGTGFYIVQESAVADTRERPYVITDVKNEDGPRKTRRVMELVDEATGKIIAETPVTLVDKKDKDGNLVLDKDGNPVKVWRSSTKAQAKELCRDQYINKGYTGNGYCRIVEHVVEGQDIAFTFKYAPSKNARIGSYVCFGIENA